MFDYKVVYLTVNASGSIGLLVAIGYQRPLSCLAAAKYCARYGSKNLGRRLEGGTAKMTATAAFDWQSAAQVASGEFRSFNRFDATRGVFCKQHDVCVMSR